MYNTCLAIGGLKLNDQKKKIDLLQPEILIGTIGRLKEVIESEIILTSKLKLIVVDEIDKIAGEFIDFPNTIKLGFSATLSDTDKENLIQHDF